MNRTAKIVGVLLVVVLALGALGAVVVSAQDDGGAATTGVFGFGRRGTDGAGLADQGAMHTAIASALGISVEEFDAAIASGETLVTLAQDLGVELATVQAAMEAVRADAINQTVSEGLITQEQAEWMLSRGVGAGMGNGFGSMAGSRGEGLGLVDNEVVHAAIASALGISVEEFEAALAGGETLVTLAQDQGVDLATVQAAMQAARADAINQAVADGLITQEHADWMLSRGFGGNVGGGFGPSWGSGLGRFGAPQDRAGHGRHGQGTGGGLGSGFGG